MIYECLYVKSMNIDDDFAFKQEQFALTKQLLKHYKKNSKKYSKSRVSLFKRLIKQANDINNIDFAIDEQINSPILGNSGTYEDVVPIGGMLDEYLPLNDFEGKSPDKLDFARDYVENTEPKNNLLNIINKLLNPKEPSIYGLPDGISPIEDLDAPNIENPQYGETNSGSTIYQKNII